jgi:hypothetical protein
MGMVAGEEGAVEEGGPQRHDGMFFYVCLRPSCDCPQLQQCGVFSTVSTIP